MQEWQQLYDHGVKFIPVSPRTKMPAQINGHYVGVTQATRDTGLIQQWVSAGWGLGAVGGELEGTVKNLCIIDCDVKKEDGYATMAALEAEYGSLPPTLNVISPSGGKHLYFFTGIKVGSPSDAFRQKFGQPSGVDIRGHHGYCCCPPTPDYNIDDEEMTQIADLPKDWEMFLGGLNDCRIKSENKSFSMPLSPEVVTEFNKANPLSVMLPKLGYKQVGPRTYCHPFGATSPSNVVLLKNQSYLPHGAEYLSWHYGAHDEVQGGPHDSFDLFRILKHHGDWDSAIRGWKFREKFSDTISLTRGATVSKSKRLEMIRSHWNQGDIVILTGVSQAYKTFFVLDAAFSMACNIHFLGVFPVRQAQSLLVLTESQGDYYDRLTAWIKVRGEENNIDPEELRKRINDHCFVRFIPLHVTNEKALADFKQLAHDKYGDRFHPAVIFFDHFSANSAVDDENSNAAVEKYLGRLRAMVAQDNSSIVVIHHPPKGNSSSFRGASVLLNNTPVMYDFKVDDQDRRYVEQVKCSYYNAFERYELQPTVTELYLDDRTVTPTMRGGLTVKAIPDFVPVKAKGKSGRPKALDNDGFVKIFGDAAMNIDDLCKATGLSDKSIYRYLQESCDEGKLERKGYGKTATWSKPKDTDAVLKGMNNE